MAGRSHPHAIAVALAHKWERDGEYGLVWECNAANAKACDRNVEV